MLKSYQIYLHIRTSSTKNIFDIVASHECLSIPLYVLLTFVHANANVKGININANAHARRSTTVLPVITDRCANRQKL